MSDAMRHKPPTKRMTQEQFDGAVRELKMAVNGLHGIVNEMLPDGFVYDPENDDWMRTGSTFYNPRMEYIGKAITGVMEWFRFLQERLGLPPGTEAKFESYFHLEEKPRRRKAR